MTTLEILQKARGLIEKGWTQGEIARGKDNERRSEYDSEAICWCMVGSIFCASGPLDDYLIPNPERKKAFLAIESAVGRLNLAAWNDESGRTQSEVLQAFDKAIEAERAKPCP